MGNPVSTPEPSVCVLLPQYKHTNPLTLLSITALVKSTPKFEVQMSHGDAFIIHARNSLATRFLASKCEWSLWVDDDMVLPTGNATQFRNATGFPADLLPDAVAGAHVLRSLLSHGKPLVGALYYERRPGGRPVFADGFNPQTSVCTSEEVRSRVRRGLHPTRWVGTGCLLAHRSVFTAIQERFPHLAPSVDDPSWQFFSPAPDPAVDGIRSAVEAFDMGDTKSAETAVRAASLHSDRIYMSAGEDVTFCRRALAAGVQPHVDLDVVCGHVGTAVYGP